MIYRLRFCNKDGVEARVDIQKGSATPIIDVEGTGNPFTLSYNNDKGNKSGMFLTSSADIEIYETADFNIDNLKTSNETELSVTYYINNIVKWKGFIIPDFFSIEVRNNPVIVMTASDRLGTLKSVTLSDLPSMVNIRELAVSCLNKTGLSLPLKTMADFSNDDTDNAFFSYYIDSQRIKDVKGRSISCYNILSSILIVSRSKLVQRAGEWVIINKLQHETGSGKLYSDTDTFTNYLESIYNFDEVSIGARRTIMPVAGSIGIYHEHGGRKSHPENYDFSLDLSGWNSMNGFTATIENKHITWFFGGTPLFDDERTVKQYLLNYNNWIDNTTNLNTAPYISTDAIPINSPRADRVEVTVDISSIMAEKLSSNTAISFLRYAVILTNGVKTYTLTRAGIFEELDPENISGHSLVLRGGQQHPLILASPALSNSESFKGLFEVSEDDDVNNYSATIRVYGSGDQYVTVNYALIKFSDVSELPKGTMYKTEQGNVFTKAYDIETSIFGDYLLSGLDGYFYRYPNDDTSSIYKDVNTLSTPVWTTPMIPDETSELPLLHHSMRQMRRLFSVAHDLLSAEIEVSDFDPLAIFVACEKRYTVVSAQFDFFKSNLSVELEEVAFQNNVIREYIYSYFGEGEDNIKNIGGISGGSGGGGTGGGLTPEQLEILSFWKKDPVNPNTIYTEMNAYSMGELSAYGIGSGGSSGGGVNLLQAWTDYDSAKDNWAVKAGLLVPFYNDTKSRLASLEGGAALSLNVTGSGNAIASLTKSGTALTAVKGNFAELDVNGKILSSQLPSYVDDVLEYVNLAAFPATGETGKIYIAQDSNKTYRWSGTAYVEISASLALGETSSTAYRGDRGKTAYDHSQLTGNPHGTTFAQIVSRPTTITGYGITDAYTKTEVNSALISKLDKSVFDDLFEKVEVSTGVFAIKAKYSFYSTGEVSAYGLGTGGSGGGSYDRLDAWADYDSTKSGWVLSALLGNELNTRVGNLEGGSALTVNTTGTGNAITSISKAGTVITATKGATFSLDNHLHTGVYEPVFTKNSAFNKNFGTTAGTVAQGNDSRIVNGQTAFGWGNHSGLYLPLTGGTMANTNLVANLNADLLDGYHSTRFALQDAPPILTDFLVWDGATLFGLRTWTPSTPNHPEAYGIALDFKDATTWYHRLAFGTSGRIRYYNGINTTTLTKRGDLAFTTDNVASATKMQTARTIWGQSFDGTVNVTGALSGATTGVFSSTVQATTAILTNLTANYLPKHTASGLINSLIYDNGTNVGIGTTSPSYKLDVSGTGRFTGMIYSPSFNQTNALGGLVHQTSATTGNLSQVWALGTTNQLTSETTPNSSFFGIATRYVSPNRWFEWYGDGVIAARIGLHSGDGYFKGNVGIGEPSPSAKLHVAGNILSTGEITAYVASDRRLKHNITTLSSSLDIIDKLNPVSYYWNAKAKELNPMKSDSLDYGLIAQEVETVLPSVVHGIFDDKYKSIDYIKLIPIMIAAIKELKQKVNKL